MLQYWILKVLKQVNPSRIILSPRIFSNGFIVTKLPSPFYVVF